MIITDGGRLNTINSSLCTSGFDRNYNNDNSYNVNNSSKVIVHITQWPLPIVTLVPVFLPKLLLAVIVSIISPLGILGNV